MIDHEESWTLPSTSKLKLRQDKYSLNQEKKIMDVYVTHVTRTIMSCHMYNIGGEVRL